MKKLIAGSVAVMIWTFVASLIFAISGARAQTITESPTPSPLPAGAYQLGTGDYMFHVQPPATPEPPTPTPATPTPVPTDSPTAPTPTPVPPPTAVPTPVPTLVPTPSPAPTSAPVPVAHFSTLPPKAPLPTESYCAAQVNAIPMPEVVSGNVPFNTQAQIPTAASLTAFHANPQPFQGDSQGIHDYANADGNFFGSTDMLIRNTACKFGIDEDVVRAQAQNESGGWHQTAPGDKKASPPLTLAQAQSACVQSQYPQLKIWNTTVPLVNGTGVTCANCCWQSWGLTQNKLYYEPTAFPMAVNSTAFTLDLTYAKERSCMNGNMAIYFASAQQQPNTYAADIASGNVSRILWGCVGNHYSGGWYDSGAQNYISHVQTILHDRSWP